MYRKYSKKFKGNNKHDRTPCTVQNVMFLIRLTLKLPFCKLHLMQIDLISRGKINRTVSAHDR